MFKSPEPSFSTWNIYSGTVDKEDRCREGLMSREGSGSFLCGDLTQALGGKRVEAVL
jgi:hypothetical protein